MLTLISALSYRAFIAPSLLEFLLKNPRMPFSSSSVSKFFNSVTTSVSISPISPKSFVLTFPRAVSEKSAIFFWAPAPYFKIILELERSIFSAKSSTIFSSSGVRTTSCTSSKESSFPFFTSFFVSSIKGSNVSTGVPSISSMFSFPSLIVTSSYPLHFS